MMWNWCAAVFSHYVTHSVAVFVAWRDLGKCVPNRTVIQYVGVREGRKFETY